MAPSSASATALEQHEDRLQRVETDLREITGSISALDIKFDYTNRTLDVLSGHLKEGFAKVADSQALLYQKLEEHKATMISRVQTLEASEERSKARSKVFAGILLAGAGSGAGLLVKWVVERLIGA